MHDILTIKNGQDYCHSKVLSLWGALIFSVLSVYVYVIKESAAFDPVAWGIGFTSIVVAGAGGAKIKQSTEPD